MSGERGINLIGHLSGNLGLGVAARNTAYLLEQMGVPFCIIDVPAGHVRRDLPPELAKYAWKGRGAAPYSVNLFHLNPPELRTQVRFKPAWLDVTRVNAIVPFWELSNLPPMWVDVMQLLDVVLAPTRFVADMTAASLPSMRIVHFQQTVTLPDGITRDRQRWGFAEGDVVFVASFDINSDLTRKNPHATIAAFREMRALAEDENAARARLVVKVNNPGDDKAQVHRLDELKRLIGDDPAITLIASSLPYADVLGLYASSDVFVSLHRAEGLGLGLLESMAMGVPVIATGYSGNMDFMTDADSRLVDYHLVAVEGTSTGSYNPSTIGTDQRWAEPHVDSAAHAMLELMDDGSRRELASAARAAALRTGADPDRPAAIEALLDIREEPGLAPGESLASLQGLPGAYWRARGLIGRSLRRLGLR